MTPTPELFPPSLDEMCRQAMARILEQINRSSGQHARRVREGFAQAGVRLLGAP